MTEIMQEALIVNPYEVSKVADYLHRYNTKTPILIIAFDGRGV